MLKTKLVIFTASFPFGLKETFFANELPYLSDQFEEILIVPLINPNNSTETRLLPPNVKFLSPSVPFSKISRLFCGIFNTAPIAPFISDFFRGKVFLSLKRANRWVNALLLFRITYSRYVSLIDRKVIHPTDVLYSYWGEAPLFTQKICSKNFKIVRMHRVDFYEEVNYGYLPNRKFIYNSCNLLLPISTDIKDRLIREYGVNESNIYISRLGVDNDFNRSEIPNKDNNIIRIVSCSRVDPVKRVRKILDAISLNSSKQNIEWHHFGDGLVFDLLKAEVDRIQLNCSYGLSINLHGWTKQPDLLRFYRTNYIDWFINVSESEGIPVSIMEAMSFGIPVIATNVGATSEIVNDENGYLVDVDFKDELLLDMILSANSSEQSMKREKAFFTWNTKYQAKVNYNNLVKRLQNIVRD